MQQTRRIPWLVVATLSSIAVFTAATPAGFASFEPVRSPGRKLSRGLANTVAGVLEVPLSISRVGQEEGPVAALSWGLLLGLTAAVTRTAVGAAEIVTFLFPLPDVGYGPILKPEFLLRPDHVSNFTERY